MITTLKTCFKCGDEKFAEDFYKHPEMADGRLGKCKECTKADNMANRNANLVRIRKYDSMRAKRPQRKAWTAKMTRKYRMQYPTRYKATTLVGNAIRSGKLVKPKICEDCNQPHKWIHGHHKDYEKPLAVDWLCPPCHKQRHMEI